MDLDLKLDLPETARVSAELPHAYGERVHLLDNLYIRSAVAKLSTSKVRLPETIGLLRAVYEGLFLAAAQELPRQTLSLPTRMNEAHPKEGVVRAEVLDPSANIVVCDVIRAGLVPSQVVFERLLSVLPEERIRLDHLNLARVADASGAVTGVDLSGSKIGGSVEGATLIIPDPMGATGSTAVRAVEHYRELHGKPARVVLLPMIATPEFLSCVLREIEDVVVYIARLDRGLSDADVLESLPGTHWDRERGLNDQSYIVPGAGGMGEVLNNSWC